MIVVTDTAIVRRIRDRPQVRYGRLVRNIFEQLLHTRLMSRGGNDVVHDGAVRRVKAVVTSKGTGESHRLGRLSKSGLRARARGRARFFEISDRLILTKDAAERAQLKRELARLTFGSAVPERV